MVLAVRAGTHSWVAWAVEPLGQLAQAYPVPSHRNYNTPLWKAVWLHKLRRPSRNSSLSAQAQWLQAVQVPQGQQMKLRITLFLLRPLLQKGLF